MSEICSIEVWISGWVVLAMSLQVYLSILINEVIILCKLQLLALIFGFDIYSEIRSYLALICGFLISMGGFDSGLLCFLNCSMILVLFGGML